MLKNGRVAVCFFGEGALGQGLLYEVMNMASLWRLPILYVCENNLYSEYTFYKETAAGDLLARPRAFGIHSEEVDGQDVRAVAEVARRLVAGCRAGEGPAFLLCHTYRYFGHHVGDINREYYRPKAEEERWKSERDPIGVLRTWFTATGSVSAAVLDDIEAKVRTEVAAGVEFARQAPYPDTHKVSSHVYA